MASDRRILEIPIGMEIASAIGSGTPKLNSYNSDKVNSVLQRHLEAAKSEGWIPTHPVEAQSLLTSGDLTYELKRGLLDSKVVLLTARIQLTLAETYGAPTAIDTKLLCPGCEHETSRFDVHCDMCGYYLPSRAADKALSLRLARHWQGFEVQRQEAERQAALAEAKAGSPGLGLSLAKAVGFGLLGLGGGIAREVGRGISKDMEDVRLQRNIREGIRGSR